MKANKKSTKVISLLLAVLLVCGLFAGCAAGSTGQDAGDGSTKSITVTVVHGDGTSKDFPIAAAGKTLRDALEQENLVEGEEGQYGLYIKTVDGETADESNQEWWYLTQDGEMATSGIDGIEVKDGDHFELTLTVGY